MALNMEFDESAFKAKVEEAIAIYRDEVIESLWLLGLECVKDAKSNGAYTDRTGNLRNSVGFVIFENGEILKDYFEKDVHGVEPSVENPIDIGKGLAQKVGSEYRGIVLVVVAGMKYAVYVESKGFNVLTSAELYANSTLPELFKN